MKTDDIRKMGLAYVQVLEKSTMDPVNPSELKGTHAQRKDKDIDNDGKVDKSDEYLHKRRQAISKAMKKEEVEQIDELKKSTIGSYINKAAVSKDKASGRTLTDTRAGKYRDAKTFAKRSKGLHTAFDKILGKARINAKEEVEQSKWPIYSRILEKRDMHVKGATPPEPIDSKASKGEKDFVNMHGGLNGNDSGIDGAKAAADTAKAAAANVKVSPKRPNDQTIGDKTMPKPKG